MEEALQEYPIGDATMATPARADQGRPPPATLPSAPRPPYSSGSRGVTRRWSCRPGPDGTDGLSAFTNFGEQKYMISLILANSRYYFGKISLKTVLAGPK